MVKERPGWRGFEGRTFLTKVEWETYDRRIAVRYPLNDVWGSRPRPAKCEVCQRRGSDENPLQLAHKIPWYLGILELGLTPEWLDGRHNLVWAHRTMCNRSVALDLDSAKRLLVKLGIGPLPAFLP